MKRLFVLLFAAVLLVACSEQEDKEKEDVSIEAEEDDVVVNEVAPVEEAEHESNLDTEEETEQEEETLDSESEIDTSMYEYSKDVKVTDAIEINNYVSLIIEMNDSLEPGLAFLHATNQTYDFLQQKALEGAEIVGINIILNETKVAMYEVNLQEFEANDSEPMAQMVLDASEMEMIIPEVEDFAEIMELEYQ